MQGSGVFEDLEHLVGTPWGSRTSTRRERMLRDGTSNSLYSFPQRRLPTSWIRRRYQELLGRVPVLTYARKEGSCGSAGKYEVSLASNARAHSQRHTTKREPEIDPVDLTWIQNDDKENRTPVRQ